MILTLPIPLFLLIVFWRLRGAEPIGLLTIRPSCIETVFSILKLLIISVFYGIGLFAYIADMNAP